MDFQNKYHFGMSLELMMAFGTCLWNLQFYHGFAMFLDFMDSYYTFLISFLTLSMISFINSCGFDLMKWC